MSKNKKIDKQDIIEQSEKELVSKRQLDEIFQQKAEEIKSLIDEVLEYQLVAKSLDNKVSGRDDIITKLSEKITMLTRDRELISKQLEISNSKYNSGSVSNLEERNKKTLEYKTYVYEQRDKIIEERYNEKYKVANEKEHNDLLKKLGLK